MDLKDYQSQIKELVAVRNSPEFNDLLNNILFGESNSNKFLIKMELNRLAKPCQRVIDLRDKVTEKCQEYQQGALKHYLTPATKKVLADNIKLYGLYTIGAYEAVHFFLTQKKEEQYNKLPEDKAPKRQEQCELLQLSQKFKRAAPRMFFVSEIAITLENGMKLKAHTSNISATGIKIKLKENIHIINQQYLQILFTTLQRQYAELTLADKVCYQVVKQEVEDNTHFLYLSYADDNEKFITFIKAFIRENQHKYKIDMQYYYQLAKISALRQTYAAQMNILPIYLDSRLASPLLFALKNQTNNQIINEWICDGVNQLPMLFDELRLTQLLAHAVQKNSTTIYSFTHHSQGKNYFISASEEQLLEENLKNTFINYGSSKNSWRVYHLTLNAFQYEENPGHDLTDPIPSQFKSITHVATLQSLPACSFSIKKAIASQDLNKINRFVHRQNQTNEAHIFTLFSDEKRKEERFQYKSKLSLSVDKTHYNGEMIDFSLSGLKIKLEQASLIPPLTKVKINLLALQQVSAKFPLSDLLYKVVRNGPNNIVHLQVCDPATFNICKQFFSLLIEKNAKFFKCIPLKRKKQPAAPRLLEVCEEAFVDCVFFVGKKAASPRIRFSAINKIPALLHSLFSMCSSHNNEFNYYPITNNHLYERLLAQPIKMNELFKEAMIYVEAAKSEENRWAINSFIDEDFSSEEEKIEFITRTTKEGKFYALHYRLSALTPPNLKYIEAEIHTISRFAIHLTKKLEEQLYELDSMIEITDRTLDVLQSIKN